MFIKPVEAFPLRRDHPPRVESEAVHAALVALQWVKLSRQRFISRTIT